MKVVVGLGNPGRKYHGTRHNVGFDVLAQLAERHAGGRPKIQFEAEVVDVRIADSKVLLVAPQTYMNLSGRSAGQLVDFYKLPLEDLCVVCDDMNLGTGQLRWRAKGSHGGQKGLLDICRHLGSQEIARLRIGVGRPPGRMDPADYVLSRFRDNERDDMDIAVLNAADSIEVWIAEGVTSAMNKFNQRPAKPKKKSSEADAANPSGEPGSATAPGQ